MAAWKKKVIHTLLEKLMVKVLNIKLLMYRVTQCITLILHLQTILSVLIFAQLDFNSSGASKNKHCRGSSCTEICREHFHRASLLVST